MGMNRLLLGFCCVLMLGTVSCNQRSIPEPQPMMEQALPMGAFKTAVMDAVQGMLFPSESDFPFEWFESNLKILPEASRFASHVGKKGEVAQKMALDAFFQRYILIEPWMDEGQVQFAHQLQTLQGIYRNSSKKLAVYRVGTVQVNIYIVAVVQGRVVGLHTISIET